MSQKTINCQNKQIYHVQTGYFYQIVWKFVSVLSEIHGAVSIIVADDSIEIRL